MAGAGVTLTIKVDFQADELNDEFRTELQKIEPRIENGMAAVASAARSSLKSHIQSDVYDKWNPSTYLRTGAIISDGAMETSVSSYRMSLEYTPDGSSEQWEHPVSDNALVARIESGSGYEWRKHPGPRPFWQKFVDEMINGGMAEAFDSAMYAELGDIYEGGTVVTRESGDGEY